MVAWRGLDSAMVVQVLVKEHDVARPLHDLKRKRHVVDARNSWHPAVGNGIDAVGFRFTIESFRQIRNGPALGDFAHVERRRVSSHPDALKIRLAVARARWLIWRLRRGKE